MYLGIDVGGTKTLVSVISDDGQILESVRFGTPHDYPQFLHDLKSAFDGLEQRPTEFTCVAGIPGHINREKGLIYVLGNLPWRDVSVGDDIAKIVGQAVIIENDAKLAGLSEALLLKEQYQKVLFATISTGIGCALIQNNQIVSALRDMEIGKMPLQFQGKYVQWEEFAGGRGLVSYLGKKADDITDDVDWQKVGEVLGYGFSIACSALQPEAIVLGGPVGKHTAKFSSYIKDFLVKNLHPLIEQPQAILAAQRPDEAVIYGCYELAKQKSSHE
jgi:predicted NBD/HSP70 family sugar kinase